MIIDLARLDAQAFDTLYTSRIAPLFEAAESERKGAVAQFKKRMTIGVPVALAIGAAIWIFTAEWLPGAVVSAFAALAAAGIAQMPLNRVAQNLKAKTLRALAESIGATYQPEGRPPALIERQRELDLLPKSDRAHFEDWFHGERHGCAFDLCEGHLEDERRDKDGDRSWVTVFRGQIIRISFPKPFQAVTVVRRDSGVFNGMVGWASRMQRVGFADPDFERKFEVYGTDQVEAHYLVHPVFAERLLQLEDAYDGKRLRCAFQNGDLLIAVETPNKYEMGDMFKTLIDPSRARVIVEDIAAVLRVMDAVLTAERAPLMGKGPLDRA
ncbi:MAG: DUF3137 domain-containing protein [Caulobacterales bacterium]